MTACRIIALLATVLLVLAACATSVQVPEIWSAVGAGEPATDEGDACDARSAHPTTNDIMTTRRTAG